MVEANAAEVPRRAIRSPKLGSAELDRLRLVTAAQLGERNCE
jgi:hypothetical protein